MLESPAWPEPSWSHAGVRSSSSRNQTNTQPSAELVDSRRWTAVSRYVLDMGALRAAISSGPGSQAPEPCEGMQ